MGDKKYLISFEGASEVAIKLLDMIEKAVGWTLMPRGGRLDFEEAVNLYKQQLLEDENLDGILKAAKIANVRRELKQYINQGKVIYYSLENLDSDADPYAVDEDWLSLFLGYAEKVSNDDIQKIWGKLLALKVNGANNITKKLINVFALMEQKDIELFCILCTMSCDNISDRGRQYPFIYIREYPAYYNNYGIRRYSLAQLDNLGLIEYDTHGNFVLPRFVPILQYGNKIIELESDKRISNGNIRFTEMGRTLYRITQVEALDDFLKHCMKVWDKMGIKYKIKDTDE